ncbi:MAG: response regulator transcription factor [Saprospiraceae bacterium]
MKILLIEDELHLGESINAYLKNEGYVCEWAKHFDDGDEKIAIYQYDCALVDITLPGGNGLELVKIIKDTFPRTGIIIISAKNALDDKIRGLDLGADDYITKPFHLAELNSRIKSVLRRRKFEGNKEVIFGEITIIPEEQLVNINNERVILTKKEFDLLLFFVSNKNRVLTKEAIAEHLWGDHADMIDSFDFIYSHIKNLRKKLIEKGGNDYVQTIYGMGYKFSLM